MENSKLIITFTFLLSILLSRLTVLLLGKTNTLKTFRPHLRSFEVHHITTGIIILVITGYLAITNTFSLSKTLLSVFYGLGLGIFVDELWTSSVVLSNHWSKEGIEYYKLPTYLIMIVISILLMVLTVI
jgi:hypothetical protein